MPAPMTTTPTIILLLLVVIKNVVGFVSSSSSSSFPERISDCKRKPFLLQSAAAPPSLKQDETGYSIKDSFNLIVLGDLHLEDDMTNHEQAREDCLQALQDLSLIPCPSESSSSSSEDRTLHEIIKELQSEKAGDLTPTQLEIMLSHAKHGPYINTHMVSLGDLGRKDIRHQPGDAGTTKSFHDAKSFLDSFHSIPYDLITGNHDLEGLDEFHTDQDNLHAFLRCFDKPLDFPQFQTQIGHRTLLLGMSTVRFRDSPHSSHEVHISNEQIDWFLNALDSHPASDGWRILVFTHAPILGSGLRVLQNVHVRNGCAWVNHSSENRRVFIRAVKDHPAVKVWCSGHFHLSHEFRDSISSVGQCAFVQVGVMGEMSTRDGRRQTRLVRGNSERMEIWSVNHHVRDEETGKAEVRLDAEIDVGGDGGIKFMNEDKGGEGFDREDWFGAYVPREEDGCYIETPNGRITSPQKDVQDVVCWWHMADGAVLGVHDGQLVEYDSETLSPLGIVVNREDLDGREVLVVEDGTAVVLLDDEERVEVVHPNDDGSYWRKFQRNKRVRQEEKAREAVAKMWLKNQKS